MIEKVDIIHTEVLKIFNVNDVIKLMYSIHGINLEE